MTNGDSQVEKRKATKTKTGSPRSRKWSTLVSVILLVSIAVVINYPYQYVAVGGITKGNIDSVIDFEYETSEFPVMGGWPFRYSISYADSAAGGASNSRFSAVALLYDVGLATLLITCVLFVIQRRSFRFSAGNGKRSRRRITIADLLLLTFLIAAPFAWWKRLESRYDQELEFGQRLTNGGGAYLFSTWVPQLIAERLPQRLVSRLGGIKVVTIEYPTDELIEELVDNRSLVGLRLGGGDFDLRLLDRLAGNPHIHDLRISGRPIDGRTIQWIGSNRLIKTLNLMRTNVSAEALASLDQLPRLERLGLIHSDVVLNDLGRPAWAETIRTLLLPHPDSGGTASLVIEGWPQLEMIQILEWDTQSNSTPMNVRLTDLPALRSIWVDIFQKVDLTLDDLPKLTNVDGFSHETKARLPRGGRVPAHLWCSRLEAQGLPALKIFSVFGIDLEYLRIRDAPQLEVLGVGANYLSANGKVYANEMPPECAAALIEGIGQSDAPLTVDLDRVPLAGVDLSPLAANHRLKEILLSDSGTNLKQWKVLAPMKWLTRLDVKECEIDGEGIQWALDSFPNLQHFAFSTPEEQMFTSYQPLSLEIVDRPSLRTLDLGNFPMEYFAKVRVVNTPNLSVALKLGFTEQLEIVNASSIKGLSVNGPLPLQVKFAGFRDLEFFAVGGRGVTDELINSISECRQLRTLTLAYPEVTAEGLKQLKGVASLTSLNLPGSAINDSVIESWPPLPNLTSLDLSHTEVTGVGLARLMEGGSVTRLILNHSKVDSAELAGLGEVPLLSELMLAGVGIDANALGVILGNRELIRLDLSDSELDPETLDVLLEQAIDLQHLSLRNCTLDDRKLAMLATRHPGLRFDLRGSSASSQLMTQLLSARRILDSEQWDLHLAMEMMTQGMAMGGSGEMASPQKPAIIDIEMFASGGDATGSPGMMGQPMTMSQAMMMSQAMSADASLDGQQEFSAPPPSIGTRLGMWFGEAIFGATPRLSEIDFAAPDTEPIESNEFESEAKETELQP